MTIKINQFANKIDRPGDTPLYQIESDGAISIVADGYISLSPSSGKSVYINSDSISATVFAGIRIGDTTEENNGTIRYHDNDFEGYKAGSWTSFTSGGGGASNKIYQGDTKAEVHDVGSDGYFWVETEGLERFRINSDGYVGIGTNDPKKTLHVFGNATIGLHNEEYIDISSKLFIGRTETDIGPSTAGLYVYRNGDSDLGIDFSMSGMDNAIAAYSYYGDSYSAAIAGYSDFDNSNSAAVFGGDSGGYFWGALGFCNDIGSWAGYFNGDGVRTAAFMNGKVSIGESSPTAKLHISAGTADANTAPIKLTSGIAMATPEDGAVEYHSSHLYFTIGSTRYQIDQQSGGGGSGDVVGPSSATNEGVARFDATTGKLIQNSLVIIGDDGYVSIPSGQKYKIDGVNLSAADVGAEPTLVKTNLTETTSSILNITNGGNSVLGASPVTISVNRASAIQDGYLGKNDFSVFSGKEPAQTKGTISSSTASAISISNGSSSTVGPNVSISINKASVSSDGYLGKDNWSTFNGKENVLTFQHSLTRSVNTVNLYGDVASPGDGYYYGTSGVGVKGWYELPSGLGDVIGPSSSIANSITRFDSISGKHIKGSLVIVGDDGYVNIPSGQKYKINNINLSAADVGAEPTQTKGNISSGTESAISISNGGFSTVGPNVSITINKASASLDGYLGKDNFSIFNSKEPALTKGNLTETSSSVLIFGGTTTNNVIGAGTSIQVKKASISQDGYLGKDNWSTFNSKESALTFQHSLTRSINAINLVGDTASPGNSYYYGTNGSGTKGWYVITSGSGDVVGPSSATNEGIVRFDTTTGKLIQNSLVIIGDDGYVSIPSGQKYKINGVNLSATDVGAEPTLAKGTISSNTTSAISITNGSSSTVGPNVSITINKASVSSDGYLGKDNWTTFNSKENALTFQHSITRSVNTINLVGDSASPGNSQYYGTNGIGTKGWYSLTSGSGDVVGPGSSTNEGIARFDGVTGKLIQNSSVIIGDDGYVSIPSGQKYKINGVNLSATDVGAEPTLVKTNLTEGSSSILTITNGSNSVIGSSAVTIQVNKASAIQDGYLGKNDFGVFSGKEPAQTKGSISSGTASAISITNGGSSTVGPNVSVAINKASAIQDGYLGKDDFVAFSSGGHNPVTLNASAITGGLSLNIQEISFRAANTNYDGYLKSSDWDTFSGKMTDPMSVDGDIVIRSGGVASALGIGFAGQVLTVNSGLPSWQDSAGGASNKIYEGNTKAEVHDTGSDGYFWIATEGVEKFRVCPSGKVGIGQNSPTAMLHLPAGTASANTAPLKFVTGTALSSPEDGAVEYDSSHLYFTIGSARYQIDQQSGGGGGSLQVSYGLGNEISLTSGVPVKITNNYAASAAIEISGTGRREIHSDDDIVLASDGETYFADGGYTGTQGPDGYIPLTDSGARDFTFPCSSLVDAINKAYIGSGGNFNWSGTTTNDTPTEIFVGGVASARYTLTADSTTYLSLSVIARDNINNRSKVWEVKAVAQRPSVSAADWVRLTPTYTVIDQTDPSGGTNDWNIILSINDPDKTVRVTVTGQTSCTIQWAVLN